MAKIKSLEFGALRVFSAISSSDSLTDAAAQLGITQSAVSQALKQLEDITEVDLVIRRSHPIKLTRAGLVLKENADMILSANGRILNEVRLADSGELASLQIGMIDSFAETLGLEYISEIRPFSSKIGITTGYKKSMSEALLNRQIDVLITSVSEANLPEHSWRTLYRDPFLIIAPEANLTGSGEPNLKELSHKLPFIHYDSSSRIGAHTDLIARRLGLQLNTRFELDSTQTLIRFVNAKYGWAIISALCLARYQHLLEGVRVISLENGSHARYISQVTRSNEMGKLPEKFAIIARELFTETVKPKLDNIAPWLAEQAYTVTERPVI